MSQVKSETTADPGDRSFLGQPRVLANLFGVELWERFSFYGMQGILAIYLYYSAAQGGLGISETVALGIVGAYGGAVYLSTIIAAWIADRLLGAERTLLEPDESSGRSTGAINGKSISVTVGGGGVTSISPPEFQSSVPTGLIHCSVIVCVPMSDRSPLSRTTRCARGCIAGSVATWTASNTPRMLSFPSWDRFAASAKSAKETITGYGVQGIGYRDRVRGSG
jgi:hypothetical protein